MNFSISEIGVHCISFIPLFTSSILLLREKEITQFICQENQ